MKYIFSFILIMTVVSCSAPSKEVNEPEFDKAHEVASILNICIQEFVPKSIIIYKKKEMGGEQPFTLYVHEKFFLSNQNTIDTLINLGASTLLKNLNYSHSNHSYVPSHLLDDFDGIHVSSIPPLTSSEVNLNVGGVQFSKVIFNKEKTKAACIFEYTYKHNRLTDVFIALEFEKKENIWQILSKTEINKSWNISLIEKQH